MDDALKLLGLMYKANKLIFGEEVYNRIQDIKLIIVANDISIKSKQRILKKCFFYDIEVIDSYDSKDINLALGKRNIKMLGLSDDGFKKLFIEKYRRERYGKTNLQETHK